MQAQACPGSDANRLLKGGRAALEIRDPRQPLGPMLQVLRKLLLFLLVDDYFEALRRVRRNEVAGEEVEVPLADLIRM